MEGSTSTGLDSVITAITAMASSVQTTGLTVLTNVLPVLATLTAGIVVANIGRRIVIKFAK